MIYLYALMFLLQHVLKFYILMQSQNLPLNIKVALASSEPAFLIFLACNSILELSFFVVLCLVIIE